MRITAEAKEATRARILDVAKRMFRDKGFDDAKIREIARGVGVATGTLFNYFPSKEEIAVALAQEAQEKARKDFERKRVDGQSLHEDLFLQVATQLRCLKPLRKFIQPVIDTALTSPAPDGSSDACRNLRNGQLETVSEILRHHDVDMDRWSMTAPIYWALYVGVLTFWAQDKSPKQEDSLAMLDQSTSMFVVWLQSRE